MTVDTIKLKREWNQLIIQKLCNFITGSGSIALCGIIQRQSQKYVQDMEMVLDKTTLREPGTILCNKCELISDMLKDGAYFIV